MAVDSCFPASLSVLSLSSSVHDLRDFGTACLSRVPFEDRADPDEWGALAGYADVINRKFTKEIVGQ